MRKLDLAKRLVNALASNGEMWDIAVAQMTADKELLVGDVLLASAFISYVGPFTKEFREVLMATKFTPFLMKEFQAAVGEEGIPPISAAADPLKILTNATEIAVWNSQVGGWVGGWVVGIGSKMLGRTPNPHPRPNTNVHHNSHRACRLTPSHLRTDASCATRHAGR